MAISMSYSNESAKVSISELNVSRVYKIIKVGSDGSASAISSLTNISSYSEYFLNAGVTYAITVIDNQVTPEVAQLFSYVDYEGAYLINSGGASFQQISLIYDENISSFKPVRKDSLVETIGSKYPFIIRSASINYKTMEFSGMVTAIMDIENFSSYGLNLYSNYNNSFDQERRFRDWFESWINDGTPKVLKTPTEGLRIVRVHNTSMTPIRQTGRVIYNFNCTITELADYTLANLIKYKFILGSESTSYSYLYPRTTLYPSDSLYPSAL
jgi:hypothetical protein